MRKVYPNTIHMWADEDNEKFTTMYLHGASYRELADHFNGTLSGMERRRIKLKLPSPTQLREKNNVG